ncbi:MAG TPA: sugar kinase [Chloroflexota bacterium]
MTKKVVGFGEMMLRLSPPGYLRIEQARSFEAEFGGGEANVLVSLSHFGIPTEYVTRLPKNEVADSCINYLRHWGLGTSHILRGGDRMGIYFLEHGSVQRGSKVVYDRSGSAISAIEKGMVDWRQVFEGADWFHITGITPAISKGAAEVSIEAASVAREMGLTVSCDLNFRAKLWKWGRPAGEVMAELVKYADVAIGNEEDAEKVFGIKAADTDVTSGKIDASKYEEVARQLTGRFPNLKQVAITLRGSLSASHNTWSGVFYDGGKLYTTRTYDITHIVDRVGGGDSFAAGIIYGMRTYGEPQKTLDFAVAASCLKHTVFGDFNMVKADEVEKLMGGDGSGRVAR